MILILFQNTLTSGIAHRTDWIVNWTTYFYLAVPQLLVLFHCFLHFPPLVSHYLLYVLHFQFHCKVHKTMYFSVKSIKMHDHFCKSFLEIFKSITCWINSLPIHFYAVSKINFQHAAFLVVGESHNVQILQW
jgi:hypothetical protein